MYQVLHVIHLLEVLLSLVAAWPGSRGDVGLNFGLLENFRKNTSCPKIFVEKCQIFVEEKPPFS